MLACGLACRRRPPTPRRAPSLPTDLNLLARVSDPQVSPDGRYVVYVQRETDLDANRGRTDLWLVDLDEREAEAAAADAAFANDTHPRWSVDGTSIYFLSSRTGTQQIWRLPLSGGEAVQITDYPLDVGTFRFSPGGGRIALSMDVFPDCADSSARASGSTRPRKKKETGRSLRQPVRAPLGYLERPARARICSSRR